MQWVLLDKSAIYMQFQIDKRQNDKRYQIDTVRPEVLQVFPTVCGSPF